MLQNTDTKGFVEFPAPAKLNLMLRVIGRRADGYHQLQTVFRFIDFADTVALRLRRDGRVRRVGTVEGVAEDQDLTVRAALALKQATATHWGVDIRVTKRLPMGGGLGGGSSDAATVLLALNQLWQTGLDRQQLEALALPLGADAPVFIYGQTAFAQGIGEILSPWQADPAWYLVLVPPVLVSTVQIFQHPELKRDSEPIKMDGFPDVVGNDLESLVCRLYPEVGAHLEYLRAAGIGGGQMSGSGACVFAAFPDQTSAIVAQARLPAGIQSYVCRGLDVHPLSGLVSDSD